MVVEFVVLLMPHGSREFIILQDYDSIEARYFERNSRVQWSKWHEWWYNRKGEPIDPDRRRLWKMWEQNHCSAYAAQLRTTPWVQTLLKKMRCPPSPFDLWSPLVPESIVGFYHKKAPLPKKRPRVEATPAESSSSSSGAVMPSATGQEQTEPGGGASSSSGAAVMPTVTGQEHTEPGGGASSSSAAAEFSVPHTVPWPCKQCLRMPWRCKCQKAQDKTVPWPCAKCMRMPWRCKCQKAEDRAPEHIQQDYELICKRAGVWEAAEALQSEADQKAAEPEPPEEHSPRDLWSCSMCSTMNTRHDLVCCVVGCGQRRPLVNFQDNRGDWICPVCHNHNWGFDRWCNWTACPSNDWRCRCGNLNRSNRKFCNRRVCRLPRPIGYDETGL